MHSEIKETVTGYDNSPEQGFVDPLVNFQLEKLLKPLVEWFSGTRGLTFLMVGILMRKLLFTAHKAKRFLLLMHH